MMLERIKRAIAPHGLMVMGNLTDPDNVSQTIVLVGADVGFWDAFTNAPEHRDSEADPVDRWSKRILGALATAEGAQTSFPSDGPPYPPFIAWAQGTGRFWPSPTGMLVHDRAGLMVSIRGALIIETQQVQASSGASPCETCESRACVSACPINALSDQHFYDVPACRAYLITPAGSECMSQGCIARRACPVSQSFNRPAAQSAFHMRAYLGET